MSTTSTTTSTTTSSSSSSTMSSSSTYSTTSSTNSSSSTTTTTTTTISWDILGIVEPKYPIHEQTFCPVIKTPKEAPYVQMRKRWTGSKKLWTLEWDEKVSMPETDYQRLEAFFIQNQGSAFAWQHYATGTVYTVMFDQDDLPGEILVPGYRMLTLKLREI